MQMMKFLIKRGAILFPAVLLGLFFFSACTEELQETEQELLTQSQEGFVGPKDNLDFAEVELFFEHLASQPNLAEMSVADQFVSMANLAEQLDIPFELDQAIASHEQGLQMAETGSWGFDQTIFDDLNYFLARYGYTAELSQVIDDYMLEISSTQTGWSQEETELVEAHAATLQYLSESGAFSNYLENSGLGADLKCEPRDVLQCAAYTAAAITYGIKCAAAWFTIVPCLLAASATAAAIYWCGNIDCDPGSPTDPCFNSPNPCCGVNCIQGYYCDSTTNGECIEDPFFECDCPPFEQCINNRCVPL